MLRRAALRRNSNSKKISPPDSLDSEVGAKTYVATLVGGVTVGFGTYAWVSAESRMEPTCHRRARNLHHLMTNMFAR